MTRTCIGRDASTSATVEIAVHSKIERVTPITRSTDMWVAPGWIDLQVNGYAGTDYNDSEAAPEEIARSIGMQHSAGVTRFFATVITGPEHQICGALRNLARAKESLAEGGAIDGFHVEGPHISPDDGPRGAHPAPWVRSPDLDEFQRWQEAARGNIRMVTLAPEWPAATRYIEHLARAGVVAAIGHTAATSEQIADAVRAGATVSTHLGNGAHGMLRRHPNYIWDQLAEDRLMAGFIVDGVHLPTAFVKSAVRAKGIERSLLVTDAAAPAGCQPGMYRQGELEVELTPDGRVMLPGRTRLAGSALRLDRAIENLMRFTGLALSDAVRMAAVNPARAGRIAGRQRGLAPGDRADLVLFRHDASQGDIQVTATYVEGERVFES